jgi:hypothetical protein
MTKPLTRHKANYKQKIEQYLGFGQYERTPTTLCRGPKGYWSDNPPAGYIVRNWKDVTCKHCLRKKPKDNKC